MGSPFLGQYYWDGRVSEDLLIQICLTWETSSQSLAVSAVSPLWWGCQGLRQTWYWKQLQEADGPGRTTYLWESGGGWVEWMQVQIGRIPTHRVVCGSNAMAVTPFDTIPDTLLVPLICLSFCRKGSLVISSSMANAGTSLAIQWLRLRLPMQGVRVWSLVGELRSHMPRGQKPKTEAVL